jgi:hypothetical protein
VTFLDAAGLGVLAGASGRARHLPGGLRLVAVPARVLRVLRLLALTGLDRHLAASPAPRGSQHQRGYAARLAAARARPPKAPSIKALGCEAAVTVKGQRRV